MENLQEQLPASVCSTQDLGKRLSITASQLLPLYLKSALPLPFSAPWSFFSCFIIVLLYSGVAPTCQILSIIPPHSGTLNGNQAGKDGIGYFVTQVL